MSTRSKLEKFEIIRKRLEGHFTFLKMTFFYIYCHVVRTDTDLLKLKNKHKGDKCFIVGLGPSLTIEDVNLLQNQWTFSMNSAVTIFDKTDWRPDYYVIVDPVAYWEYFDLLKTADLRNVFFGCKHIGSYVRKAISLKVNSAGLTYEKSKASKFKPKELKFSINPKTGFYEGHSTVYVILQLAAYMGFSEIYLLGCDCNYHDSKNDNAHSKLVKSTVHTPEDAGDRMIQDYITAKKGLDALGIKVYNATRGGELEVFERVNLSEILTETTIR